MRSDDITLDPRYGHNEPHHGMPAGHLQVRSYLAVPVVSRSGAVIGGLFFGHSKPGVFTEESEQSMNSLAGEAAVAINNVRLNEETQREVAERRRAEAALRDLNADLEEQVRRRTEKLVQQGEALRQAQKMEAIGQLTGGIAHALRELGYIVIEAMDAHAALCVLRFSEVDLLFTDVVLPGGMTGEALAASAKQLHPGIRVLFTTGYARNAIVHQGRLDPGVQLITKPFTFDDVASKLREVLDA